ncbi:B3 domain-containing transcription factor VRN1-like [Papaver somniferum]|uniref:B3 domain-containing transcription factor VRN1-like n=1 Tax=Papaver somniferum TaxID=3469 RepID=UPI000E70438D|nr:B3 domain-containing transcription factor VRN1-like [Papaver somniferum]
MAITRNQRATRTPGTDLSNSQGNFVASADDDGTNEIGRRHPQFFQIIHNAIIQDGNLIIPPRFVAKHGADLSHHVTLRVPDGLTWDVQLKRDSNGGNGAVSFRIGQLDQFFEYYSIRAGHLLLFKYHGNSQFLGIILDISACEIKYPAADDDDDHRGSSEIKSSEEEDYYVHASTDEDESSASLLSSSSEEKEVAVVEKKKKKHTHLKSKAEDSSMRGMRQRATLIGDEFQSENPFFTLALQPAYIKRKYLQIPTSFNDMHMFTPGKKIRAQVKDGSEDFWILGFPRERKPDERRLTVGVAPLLKDNYLNAGDVILVELMKDMKSSYLDAKVHIFRANRD